MSVNLLKYIQTQITIYKYKLSEYKRYSNLLKIILKKKPISILEIGVYKGLRSLEMIKAAQSFNSRIIFTGFDMFEMFFEKKNILRNELSKKPKSEQVISDLLREHASVKLVKGKLPGTINKVKLNKISFLHIDLNSSKAEILSVTKVWNKINKGGIILLDDYCYSGYLDTKNAWNKFAKEKKISILPLPTGQGVIFKN